LRSILRLVSSTLVVIGIARSLSAQNADDIRRWERQAQNVTIIRDDWGIAHVYGKTDADAVFGMEYAQAEDDFNRIETNYLNSLGRLAEAEGEAVVFQDLRQKLFVDPDSLRAQYARSPAWLKQLMDAFADGLNFFLYKHPEVKPRVITRFEPWMALSFTEGSIGGDIERISVRELTALYGDSASATSRSRTNDGDDDFEPDPSGSNGIAIAPRLTANRRALLWINPHTSFYFRSELQMVSEEGLNAYGAVTWGQFFIYQGFNASAGWMHTSSGVDNIDEFYEARGGTTSTRKITVPFKGGQRTFTVQYTPRGPIVRKEGDRLVSVSLMWQPTTALIQSYSRTKARNLAEYRKIMDLHTNSSNNTVYADAEGNIAYFHSNYIPRRDTSFDWTRPVDAANPATAHKGVLSFDETPNVVNPASGWVYNANNWPWSAAGEGSSPNSARYPRYVETSVEETARGFHALRVLVGKSNWTMNTLRDAAFDSYLPAFERMIPPLLAAYDQASTDTLKSKLAEPVAALRAWDYRWGSESVPTALAVLWGGSIGRRVARDARAAGISVMQYLATSRARPSDLLGSLADAVDTLNANFGTWKTSWGTINRFQRISPEIAARFDDAQPSIPVPFTASVWGSLAAYGSRPYSNTKKWYGTSGNSFVAVVEFGDSVRAKAVTAGGESGSPRSPHFNDQAERYASGNLRDVYFYRSQLAGHTEREYHPGERVTSR
jgi:acyl-homoserine lactone acylase PvdQ